ncbi:MAG: ABC transporter ATP-binding protein [Kiritimatiellae bacterium]|nr:ABC transporter ATP-binding protein [Kiritimatiellia bacterium]
MQRLRIFIIFLTGCMAHRKRLLLMTLFAVLSVNIFEIAFPKLMQLYIDSIAGNTLVLGGVDLSFLGTIRGQLIILPCVLLVFAGVRWIATYARAVLETRLGQGALYDLRSRIFNTMQNLSFAYHDASHSGTLISNVVEDVNYSSLFFQQGLFNILASSIYTVFAYIYMFLKCPQAACASLSLLILVVPTTHFYFKYGYKYFARTKRLFAEMVQLFTEKMEGHLVVRAFGVHADVERLYGKTVDKLHSSLITERMVNTALFQGFVWAAVFGTPLVLAVGIHAGRAGTWDVTGGNLFLLFFLQGALVFRMRMLTRGISLSMWFAITVERLNNLFDAGDFLSDEGVRHLPSEGAGSLEICNVSFSYPGSSRSLQDISLNITSGQTVGIVGRTGSGKSTLALLMCRFHDPDKGEIILDGRDIRDYRVRDVRDQFSLVFQETFLFSASIRDNIGYGRSGAGFEDIVYAASIAKAHEFIMELQDGYDTVVGEKGVTLSGGQRQRISIARAILRRPRFLVLDACTSAVDPITEKAIQDGLDNLGGTTTRIIIAQRFSSIAAADNIYVLDNGKIVEEGHPSGLNVPGTMFTDIMRSSRPNMETLH